MHLSRAAVPLLVLVAAGCKAPPPAPVPAPPPQQLTEKDTEPLQGALSGPGWRLLLDDRWLAVKSDARARFKPEVEAWAVDPDGPVHLTVQCRALVEGAEASLRAQLALAREQHDLEGVAMGKLGEGPWLEGVLGQWTVGEMAHVIGRFRLVSSVCDVRAWAPKAGGAPTVERLRSSVLAFSTTRPGLVRELNALGAWLSTRARPHAADAGTAWVRLRTEDALLRAPAGLLVERFTLRLQLLEEIGQRDCANVVRQRLEESPALLERLPDPVGARWVQLTREALTLAESADAGRPAEQPGKLALLKLAAQDEELGLAQSVLKRPDEAPDDVACDAEKLRLTKLLAQPAEQRALLLRSLL